MRNIKTETGHQLAAITVGKAGFNDGVLQKLNSTIQKNTSGEAAGTLIGLGLLGGGITAFIAGAIYDCSFLRSVMTGVGVLGLAVTPIALVCGLYGLAGLGQKKRNAILIQPNEVEKVVSSFDNANGAEKIAIGNVLSKWLDELKGKRCIEPETGAELQRVVDALNALPTVGKDRVQQLNRLLEVLAEKGEVTSTSTDTFKAAINAFPEAERADLAEAIFALVKASGRGVDYDAKHALFALAAEYKRAPKKDLS